VVQCYTNPAVGGSCSDIGRALGLRTAGNIVCLDGGYAWGGQLAAYDVENRRLAATLSAK